MLRRFRIQKCCSLCGKWELRDRSRRLGAQYFRLNSRAECVQKMNTLLAIAAVDQQIEKNTGAQW